MGVAFCLNMVFNHVMTQATTDRELIERLGGPTRVAELLGWPKHGGAQRVQNWLTRGIPPAIKVHRPDLFLVDAVNKTEMVEQQPEGQGG